MAAIVQASNISRHFGSARALDGVDLEVREGEIFGIVGPNGAGKTTLLNLCAGLDTPTSGTVEVFGLNPATSWDELASRVGVQMQSSALPPRLRVGEALELYSALYPEVRPWKDVLEELGIGHKEDARIEKLSGGERQRVFIALTLLHKPELAFLDEITTALDPQSRRDMWETVKHVRDNGATVVLTTHYMEEAEYLCDRVAIIDQGDWSRAIRCPTLSLHTAGSPQPKWNSQELYPPTWSYRGWKSRRSPVELWNCRVQVTTCQSFSMPCAPKTYA